MYTARKLTRRERKHQFGDNGLAIGENDLFLRHHHGQLHDAQYAKHGQTQRARYGEVPGHLHGFCGNKPHGYSRHVVVRPALAGLDFRDRDRRRHRRYYISV